MIKYVYQSGIRVNSSGQTPYETKQKNGLLPCTGRQWGGGRKQEEETEKKICYYREQNQRRHAHQYTQNRTDVARKEYKLYTSIWKIWIQAKMSNLISKCRAVANFNYYMEKNGVSHYLKNNLYSFFFKALPIFWLFCTFHRVIN